MIVDDKQLKYYEQYYFANELPVPFKVKDKEEYLLAWTTTPWTLMANVALCVNPDEKYVKVKSMGYTFILADALKEKVLGEEIEVVEEETDYDKNKLYLMLLLDSGIVLLLLLSRKKD